MGSAPYIGGGFGHFYAFREEKIEYCINRFAMETKRLLDVLNRRLAENRFLCGDEYTIADMANYGWYGALVLHNLYDAEKFPRCRLIHARGALGQRNRGAPRGAARPAGQQALGAGRRTGAGNVMVPRTSSKPPEDRACRALFRGP